jgi:hypothetical protein
VRVFLPRSATGEAQCRPDLYEAVANLPGVEWGQLPKDLLRRGPDEGLAERFVHAKVYRFFTPSPKKEFLFVGSPNLTSAAHQTGGNLETGFLVQIEPPRRPEFWLTPEEHEQRAFAGPADEADASGGRACPLNLRYHWDQSRAEAFWDATGESPALWLEARGLELGDVPPVPSRSWVDLPPDLTTRLGDILQEASLVTVHGAGTEETRVLVQEEGMSHKPSLLFQLSIADILRCWSLLTPAQRAAFIDARVTAAMLEGQGADLVARARILLETETLFDRFAGAFHAFGCLERAIREALDQGNTKDADYRLFGRKYDSLGSLLDRVLTEDSPPDDVDRYVMGLCAEQLRRELAGDKTYRDYWESRATDAEALRARLAQLARIRSRLIERNGPTLEGFLDWLDDWFLQRAEPVTEDRR